MRVTHGCSVSAGCPAVRVEREQRWSKILSESILSFKPCVSVLPAILSQLCLSMLEGGDVLLSLWEPPRASQITHKLAVKHTNIGANILSHDLYISAHTFSYCLLINATEATVWMVDKLRESGRTRPRAVLINWFLFRIMWWPDTIPVHFCLNQFSL